MITESEPKVAKSFTIDPTVAAWVAQKAALLKLKSEGEERISDSSVVNEILRAAMEKDQGSEDFTHLQRFLSKKVLKTR